MKTDNIEVVEEINKNPKTISDYTVTELKALVYDSLAIIEQHQSNIKFINEELAKRK